MNLVIHTDGSSRGNPGPGAYAFLVKCGDKAYEGGSFFENTTNNRMEIMGVIAALEFIKDKSFESAVINCDSQYVVKGVNEWLFGWKNKNWKNSAKEDVKNRDLWEKIDTLCQEPFFKKVKIVHIKGHNGDEGNERADFICTSLAEGKNPSLTKDVF